MTEKNTEPFFPESLSLRAYTPEEFLAGLQRLIQSPQLPKIAQHYFPDLPYDRFVQVLKTVKNVDDFQAQFISTAIHTVLKKTSRGLTVSGLENLSKKQKYLFISNHRDIICDPALLTNSLFLNGYPTPQICLGDNLLSHPLIVDLVKMNKGITVKRTRSPRELLASSRELSEFIFDQINGDIDSVWIAHREGRAKDGNDRTQQGILKMFTLSRESPFLDRLQQLHLVPVAISYEYDPCDALKARELHILSTQQEYRKSPNEDTQSIIRGITEFKGRIHIAVDEDLTMKMDSFRKLSNPRDQMKAVVDELDHRIHKNYRLWPSNYIAYDLLEGSAALSNSTQVQALLYTNQEKEEFIDRMENQLQKLSPGEGSPAETAAIRNQFLSSYAFPVRNALSLQQGLLS